MDSSYKCASAPNKSPHVAVPQSLIRTLRGWGYSLVGEAGKRGEDILEEALLGIVGGLLGYVKTKFLVISASSGACS